MATDVSRVSFDSARKYTRVLSQQGRVLLEAEENEDGFILAEERRHDLLDLIGPAGTPDDGYAVSSTGPGNLTIGPGTMYVGGLRVSLETEIDYAAQPDWLDHVGDPDWVDPPNADNPGGVEHVVLELIETDVTAVEDPVLREVALGGPDGAARARLLQRVRRMSARARDCEGALATDEETWLEEGLVFDEATAQLGSATRLLVTWDAPEAPADPCAPSAQGGYLGADNQAIRVEVVRRNPDQPDVFDLVWGWDDASMIYRVMPDASANPVLTLQRSPVDDAHRPRAGQAVQVLRSAAALASTDSVVEGYVASLDGPVDTLTAPYDPDRKTVQFPAPLPAEFTDPTQTPQLYLRVWETVVRDVRIGDEVPLTGTGLRVTLTLDGAATVHPGDFWIIGVRPATPTTVLPARLLRTPQPPDGPRMWACPLAVVAWTEDGIDVLDDCRVVFDPLPELECCCTVTVRPRDAVRLQALIDRAAAQRPLADRAHRVTICLRPGRYLLPRPLQLGHRHSHLHLEGCGEGAVLAAAPGRERAFLQGLVTLVHADNVRISGLELEMPQVPGIGPAKDVKATSTFQRYVSEIFRRLTFSVGIRPVHCAELEIDRCLFRFTLGPGSVEPESPPPAPHAVVGIGIFAGSECWGLRLERNRFLHDTVGETSPRSGLQHMLVGVLLAPTMVVGPTGTTVDREGAVLQKSGTLVPSILERGRIVGNDFHGLTVGACVMASLGEIRVEDNVARECHGGIWLFALGVQSSVSTVGDFQVTGSFVAGTVENLAAELQALFSDEFLLLIALVGRIFPLPVEHPGFTSGALHTIVAGARIKQADRVSATERFVAEMAAPFAAAGHAGAQPLRIEERPAPATTASPFVDAATAVNGRLIDADRLLAEGARAAALRLRVCGNDLECGTGDRKETTGPALLVYAASPARSGSALVSDNRMTGRASSAIAAIAMVPNAAVTANLIRNENGDLRSLALLGCRQVAVTGNIVQGPTLLPPRPFGPPLDTWSPLNTGM